MKNVNQIIEEAIHKIYKEDLNIPLNPEDEILYGKFKNKKAIVKDFKKDDKGLPVAITDKGEIPLLKIRIPKVQGDNNENN